MAWDYMGLHGTTMGELHSTTLSSVTVTSLICGAHCYHGNICRTHGSHIGELLLPPLNCLHYVYHTETMISPKCQKTENL